jgi:beta-galactosidase
VGARTATRNLDNNVVPETIPGCLRGLCGITVEEYGKQNAPQSRPLPLKIGKKTIPTNHWYESLKLDSGTKPLATWAERHIAGEPAISLRKLGKGSVVYVGTYFTAELMAALLPELQKISALEPLWKVPPNVEVVCRQNHERRVWFFMNHSETTAKIAALPAGTNLFSGLKAPASTRLAAREVLIIQENPATY